MRLKVNSCMHSTHNTTYCMTDVYVASHTHSTHISMVSSGKLFSLEFKVTITDFPVKISATLTYLQPNGCLIQECCNNCGSMNLRRTKHDFVCGLFDVTHNQFNHLFFCNIFSNTNRVNFHANLIDIVLNSTTNGDWHRNETITIKFNN